MKLKTVIPNPCEHCSFASINIDRCLNLGGRCQSSYDFEVIVNQRDADQKIVDKLVEALIKIASCEIYYEGDTIFIARDVLRKVED